MAETARYESFADFVARLKKEADRVFQAIANGTLGEEDFSVDSEGNPIDRDSPLAQIYQTIIGRANDIPPEILQDATKAEAAFQRIFFGEVARIQGEINNAGGFEQWQNQQQQADEQNVIQQVLDQARETGEGLTKEEEETFKDIFQTIKNAVGGAIPTSGQDLKDLLESILKNTAGVSKDCETWTGRVGEGEGGSNSAPGSAGGTYQGWKDCVNIGAILSIPGLNIPLPPGMVDITWKELEDAVKEAGQNIRDVLSDPGGWLEDAAEKAKEKVRQVLGTLSGGISDKDLEDIIRDAVGGVGSAWIGRYIRSSVEQEIKDQFPNIFITDPDVKPDECKEGTYYSEQTGKCEPIKQAPIGPTAEECAEQNRAHIPGEKDGTSRCGGCLSGYEVNQEGVCTETLDPCPSNQVRNETTGKCEEPPPGFVEGAPCKTEAGEDGTYDASGACIADGRVITPDDGFGMCPDGVTPKQDKQGSNCGTVTTNPCEDPDYAAENQQECEGFPTRDPEPEDETCANGAVDWPLCSECADDTKPSDHEDGVCPGPTTEPPVNPPVNPPPGGGGGGGGQRGTPFMTGLNYQLPMLQQIIAPPQRDYSAGLLSQPKSTADYNQALGSVIAGSLQKRKKGMFGI